MWDKVKTDTILTGYIQPNICIANKAYQMKQSHVTFKPFGNETALYSGFLPLHLSISQTTGMKTDKQDI